MYLTFALASHRVKIVRNNGVRIVIWLSMVVGMETDECVHYGSTNNAP
jgi:hypothetical protein